MAEIRKMTITALVIASLFVMTIPVSVPAAQGTINMLIAYDEEFDEHGYMHYVAPYGVFPESTEGYIDWQLSRAFYWFELNYGQFVSFQVLDMVSWDSDDSYHIDEMLLEAEIETGFAAGLYPDGTVLICFTYQNNGDGLQGGCLPENRSLIIRHYEEWADDNVLLHELSHLWILDHCLNECLMSYLDVQMLFYDEPLAPEHGHITLMIGQTEHWSVFAYSWCADCDAIMRNHLSHEYPPPPDPWMPALGSNKDPIYFVIVAAFIIMIIGLLILCGYELWKYRKKIKLVKNTKSSINFLNIMYLTVKPIGLLDDFLNSRGMWIPPEKRRNHNKHQVCWRRK